VITLTGRFLQYYRQNANWLERTYAFVPRVGLEKIRAVVADDSEGIAARLDAAMQASVDAYRDPWQERDVTPGQFRTALPLIPLPQVPVRETPVAAPAELARCRGRRDDRRVPVAWRQPPGGVGGVPARGRPIADRLADADVVICPLHQHVFELANGCSRTGQPPLRVYPVRVENDQIIVEGAADWAR
jgi:hypothetical protein